MREGWLVSHGDYEQYTVAAVCSSYEQACGVAVSLGASAEEQSVSLYEPDDGVLPFAKAYQCTVARAEPYVDDGHVQVIHSFEPVPLDGAWPEPKIALSIPENYWQWVKASGHRSPEDAEVAARAAYQRRAEAGERLSFRAATESPRA